MNHEEIVNDLMDRHVEIYDYIISMNFLNSVEEEFSVNYPLLLNRSVEILHSLCEEIGIIVFNDELFENSINIITLSDIYLFLLPGNLSRFLINNKDVYDLLISLLDSDHEHLLKSFFENLQVIFINDGGYKKKYDLINWNLENDERFITYISGILRMIESNMEEDLDIKYSISFTNRLRDISLGLKERKNMIDDEYNHKLKIWLNSISNSSNINIFGWYLENKNEIDINKILLEEFNEKYTLLKKTTIGYEEYYNTYDISILEKEIKLINLVKIYDPFI